MDDRDDERRVGRLYRELPREEPPAPLDDAIRARARRAGGTHPAPLVPPTGRRTWHYPVAAAAVLMLAVALTTWQVEQDEPDPLASAPAPIVEAKKEGTMPPDPLAVRRAKPQARGRAEPAAPPAAAASAPPAEAGGAQDPAGVLMSRREMSVEERAAKVQAIEPPERWLERIAKLRREGKHEEADRALAEFRKRYPDFIIPPELLRQVEKP